MILNNDLFNRKLLPFVGMAACATLMLSGCQSTTKSSSHQVKTSVVTVQQPIVVGKSTLSCAGVYACEINSIGKMPVINQTNHKPSPTLSHNSHITLTSLGKTSQPTQRNLPNYLVSFPSGQQMVTTRFYLDGGLNTAENFSFIHNFESGKRYQIKAYRQIQQTDYSLLAQSAPTPLCVDLYENDKLANKWCKKPNQQGALTNEFIKVPLN